MGFQTGSKLLSITSVLQIGMAPPPSTTLDILRKGSFIDKKVSQKHINWRKINEKRIIILTLLEKTSLFFKLKPRSIISITDLDETVSSAMMVIFPRSFLPTALLWSWRLSVKDRFFLVTICIGPKKRRGKNKHTANMMALAPKITIKPTIDGIWKDNKVFQIKSKLETISLVIRPCCFSDGKNWFNGPQQEQLGTQGVWK